MLPFKIGGCREITGILQYPWAADRKGVYSSVGLRQQEKERKDELRWPLTRKPESKRTSNLINVGKFPGSELNEKDEG